MKNTSDIYVSDLFAIPTPKHTGSPAVYRRKLLCRRLLWAGLPYLLEGAMFVLTAALIVGGLLALFCGLG